MGLMSKRNDWYGCAIWYSISFSVFGFLMWFHSINLSGDILGAIIFIFILFFLPTMLLLVILAQNYNVQVIQRMFCKSGVFHFTESNEYNVWTKCVWCKKDIWNKDHDTWVGGGG